MSCSVCLCFFLSRCAYPPVVRYKHLWSMDCTTSTAPSFIPTTFTHRPSSKHLLSPAARRLLASSSSILRSTGPNSRPGSRLVNPTTAFSETPTTSQQRSLTGISEGQRQSSSLLTEPPCPSPVSVHSRQNRSNPTNPNRGDAGVRKTEQAHGESRSITDDLLNLRTPQVQSNTSLRESYPGS